MRQNPTSLDVEPGRIELVRRGNGKGPTILAVGPTLEAVEEIDATVLYATRIVGSG